MVTIVRVDEELYYGVVVYARYRTPELVRDLLMDKNCQDSITFLSEKEGEKKALNFASSTMVVLDSDDETEAGSQEAGKFIFCLADAASMKLISTPVRGIKCKHFQVGSTKGRRLAACPRQLLTHMHLVL